MKKSTKLIIGILVTTLLLTGTGYAAVKKFKGFQVVNVLINGSTYNGDVPAVLVDGKVWVSAKVADKMGGKSSYNKNTNKLIISGKATNEDIETIKAYSKIAQYYDRLSAIGDSFYIFYNMLDTCYYDIEERNDTSYLIEVDKNFKDQVSLYNDIVDEHWQIISLAAKYNLKIDDIYEIFNNYKVAMDSYEKASKALKDFANGKNNSNYNLYSNNRKLMGQYGIEGEKLSVNGNQDFFEMISNY